VSCAEPHDARHEAEGVLHVEPHASVEGELTVCCCCEGLSARAFDPCCKFGDISEDIYSCRCSLASARMAFDQLLFGHLEVADLPGCGDLDRSEITTRLSARLGHRLSLPLDTLRHAVANLVACIVRLLPRVVSACRDSCREEAVQLMSELWELLEVSFHEGCK
jgi:hypothetical protein